MKEFLESLSSVLIKTGGVGFLVLYPLLPLLLLYAGLQAAGRGIWSSGTRRKDQELADYYLSRPRFPGDEFYREMAETTLRR